MEELLKFLEHPSSHALTFVLGLMTYHYLWGRRMQKGIDEIYAAYKRTLDKIEGKTDGK